ncbi:hypothetical protein D3C72_2588190 [compost metagenome]
MGSKCRAARFLKVRLERFSAREKASLPATVLPRSLVWLAAGAAANGAPSNTAWKAGFWLVLALR